MKSANCCDSSSHQNKVSEKHQEKFLINPDIKYEPIRSGKGTFSQVYLARYLDKSYAYKIFKKSHQENEQLHEEIRIHLHLNHMNITTLYYITINKSIISGLLLEYAELGSLKKFIDKEILFTWEIKIEFIRHLFTALEYLHGQGIIHQDIKVHNMLVFWDPVHEKYLLKLSDFGGAVDISGLPPIINAGEHLPMYKVPLNIAINGTLLYKSPEIVSTEYYIDILERKVLFTNDMFATVTTAIDIYAASLCMYYIITGKFPWNDFEDSYSSFINILLHDKLSPGPLPLLTPDCLRVVYEECRLYDPQKRLTVKQALELLPTQDDLNSYQWRKPASECKHIVNGVHTFFKNKFKCIDAIDRMPIKEIELFNTILQLKNDNISLSDFCEEEMKLSYIGKKSYDNLLLLLSSLETYINQLNIEFTHYFKSKNHGWPKSILNDNDINKYREKIPNYFLENNVLGIAIAQLNLLTELRHEIKTNKFNMEKIKELEQKIINNQIHADYKFKITGRNINESIPYELDDNVYGKGQFFIITQDKSLISKSTENYDKDNLRGWIAILTFSTKQFIKNCQSILVSYFGVLEPYQIDTTISNELMLDDDDDFSLDSDDSESSSDTISSIRHRSLSCLF